MTVFHLAVAHDYVLAGTVPQTAVHVSATLDSYTVIAGVEEAVLY